MTEKQPFSVGTFEILYDLKDYDISVEKYYNNIVICEEIRKI